MAITRKHFIESYHILSYRTNLAFNPLPPTPAHFNYEEAPAPPVRIHSIERSLQDAEISSDQESCNANVPKLPPKNRLTPLNSLSGLDLTF